METKGNLSFNWRSGKKSLLAAMIVACSAVFLALMLTVAAFATGIGEDALNFLFGDSSNISSDEAVNYPAHSTMLNGEFTEADDNASSTISVNFVNNYTDERVRQHLAGSQVKDVESDTSFSFTFSIEQSYGMPTVEFDTKSGVNCQVNADGSFTLSSDIGISENINIEAKYGSEIYPYTLHVFYEDSDGNWGTYSKEFVSGATLGADIPTAADKEKAAQVEDLGIDFDDYEFDAQSVSKLTASGDDVASLYYRVKMVDVVFDANEGFGGPGFYSLRAGSIIKDISSKTPLRGGYTFDGWYTEPKGGEEVVIPDTGFVVPNSNTTLYAHWDPVPGKKYVTVVYWGQNAELTDDEFNTDDYSYISEAYLLSKEDFSDDNTEKFDINEDQWKQYIAPYTGNENYGTLTKVINIDADKTRTANVPITDCYDTENPIHTDSPVVFRADNYASFNVYLPRKTYTWEFRDLQDKLYTHGTITARWNQDIKDKFVEVCKDAYGESATNGPWLCEGTQGQNDEKWQMLFTNMTRVNRIGEYSTEGTGCYRVINNPPETTELRYYLQKVDGGDEHSNIQATTDTSGNYELFTTLGVPTNMSFSEEEFINLEGFVKPAPSSEDTVRQQQYGTFYYPDAPFFSDGEDSFPIEQNIEYHTNDGTTGYSGWSLFYKRVESKLYLNIIKPSDEHYSELNTYSDWIEKIDYGKKLADITVPEGIPGTFNYPEGVEHNRQLQYFVPVNPGLSTLDGDFIFDGWAFNNAVGSQAINWDTTYMGSSDMNLYAKWKAPTFNVTFNQVKAPKTEEVDPDLSVTVEGTYKQKLTTYPDAKVFPKHYFEYWYYHDKDESGNDIKVYFDPNSMTIPLHDLVLFPEYSCNEMDPEYSVTIVNDPLVSHGNVSATSNPMYAIKDTAMTVDGNKLTVEDTFNLSWGDEVTATGLTDETGNHDFDCWQISTDGTNWTELTTDTTITGNCFVRPVFTNVSDQRAKVTSAPQVVAPTEYTGNDISTLNYGGAAENGTMQYAISKGVNAQPDFDEFSTEIPTMKDVDDYYIFYYAKGEAGYAGSDVGVLHTAVTAVEVTAQVTFNSFTEVYTGSAITYKDKACYYVSVDPQYIEMGLDVNEVDTDVLVYVTGTEAGTYTGQAFSDIEFSYTDPNFDVTFELATTSPTAPTLTIVSEATEVPIPTWVDGSLTYNGQAQGPSRTQFWDGYDTSIMSIGMVALQVNAGTYTATFNINSSSYVFPGGVKSATAYWTIDMLDMDVEIAGWDVYKESNPPGSSVTITGPECFDAVVLDETLKGFFDKNKIHAMKGEDEISITANSGESASSDIFKNYEWTYDDSNVHAILGRPETGYSTLHVDQSEVTPPVASGSLLFDNQDHNIIAQPGSADGHTMYYNVTVNDYTQPPVEGWSTEYTDFKAKDTGLYYIWYKVDEDGTPTLLVDTNKEPDEVELAAAFAVYIEDGSVYGAPDNILRIELYFPSFGDPTPEEMYEDGFQGYIPIGLEYTSAAAVPWADKLSDVEYAYIDQSMVDWFASDEDEFVNPGTGYMSHWFDGASNLETLIATEQTFYSWATPGQLKAVGTNVFTGCTKLLGGNGTSLNTLKDTGVIGLKEDYYTIDTSTTPTTYTIHPGYLGIPMANIVYDYDFGELDLVEKQYVSPEYAFAVGGVNGSIAPVPTRTGYNFVGWQVGYDTSDVYEPGTVLPVADYLVDENPIYVKAIWEEAPEPVVTPPTLVNDFWYDGQSHTLIDQPGSTTSGTLYYGVSQDPEVAPETWFVPVEKVMGSEPGKYYVWYKVDGGTPTVVSDSKGPIAVASNSLLAEYYETGDPSGYDNFLKFSLYKPKQQDYDLSHNLGFVVGAKEYAVTELPWYSVMNQIQYVSFDSDVKDWFTMKTGEKGHMNNWFNGASKLKKILSTDAPFIYNDAYLVDGENIFNGCDNLYGGNGTAYKNRPYNGTTYLRNDRATSDPRTGSQIYGYLTSPAGTGFTVNYDLNGGSVPAEKQYLLSDQFGGKNCRITVGGIDNFFVNPSEVVPPEGKYLAGWNIVGQTEKLYVNGDSAVADSFEATELNFVAVWKDQTIVEPTANPDSWYDAYIYKLFATPGSATSGTIKYSYSFTPDYPLDTWYEKYDDVKVSEDGTYYLWYKVDDEQPVRLSNTVTLQAIGAYYDSVSNTLTIKNTADRSDTTFLAAIPRARAVYAEDTEGQVTVPWASVMTEIKHVVINNDISEWLEPFKDRDAFMNNWFNGATSLMDINVDESLLYNQDGSCKVVYYSTFGPIFANCNNLIGGNGTKYATVPSDGIEYLKNDFTDHAGYLSPVSNAVNVQYDYNGGTGATILNSQKVEFGKNLNVTGVNNAFATQPTKEGFNFAGWLFNGQTYNTNQVVNSSFGGSTKYDIVKLVAQWNPITEKQDQEVGIDIQPAENFYVKQFGKLEVTGLQDNPTMYWTIDDETPLFSFSSDFHTYVAYVHAFKAGLAHATLHVAETDLFNPIDVPVEFRILGQIEEGINLNDRYDTIVEETVDIEATGISDGRLVSWSIVSGADVISLKYINNNPVAVTGLKEGTAVIEITAEETIEYAQTTARTTINVGGPEKESQNLVLSEDELRLDVNETGDVTVSGDLENPLLSWQISDPNFAIIASDTTLHTVTVKGKAYGTTTLTVTTLETEHYAQTSKTINVVVQKLEDVYLKNRGTDKDSIIAPFREATSAEFTKVIPEDYLDSIVIDDQNAGTIKAYKVATTDGFKVVIASTHNICTNETSFASFFKGFVNLKSVSFGDVNTNRSTSLVGMFSGCHFLESVYLPFNTTNVVNYGYMFDNYCTKLERVEIGPNFVMNNNASLSYMFDGCSALGAIVVPAGTDWSNVSGDCSGMFRGANNLPYFDPYILGKDRAYVGEKSGVYGYFTQGSSDKAYLMNRGTDKDSIIKEYREAKSVVFSHNEPATSISSKDIDVDHVGKIKAYQVKDGDGYKVVVYSPTTIYTSGTSFASFFKHFTKLETVDFGDVDTSEATSFIGMFSKCEKLVQVTLNFNTPYVSNYSYMFDAGCLALKEIDFGDNFIIKEGADLTCMFENCTALTTVKVKTGTDWSLTAGASGGMFANCSHLPNFEWSYTDKTKAYCGLKDGKGGYFTDASDTYVYLANRGEDKDSIIKRYRAAEKVTFSNTIPTSYSEVINVDAGDLGLIKAYKIDKAGSAYDVIIASQKPMAANETSFASMFKSFENLTSVDFGNINTDSITSLVGMFSGCGMLTSVNLETFNTSKVTNFGWMFDNWCTSLTEVKLSDKFVVQENAVLNYMFDGCTSLSSIIVPTGTDWTNVKGDSSFMFRGCLNLPGFDDTEIDYRRAYQGTKDGKLGYFSDGSTGEATLVNRGLDKDSIIKNYRGATSVTFTHSQPSTYDESIAIDKNKTGVIKAYKVSEGSTYKVVIYCASTIYAGETSLASFFKNFEGLTSVDFGDLNTSKATSLIGMFSGCRNLPSVTMNFDTSKVTTFGYMFDAGCVALNSVVLGDSFVVSNSAALTAMFEGCTALQTIQVKNGTDWSGNTADSYNMFYDCKLLPGFTSSVINNARAYTGTKSGVVGYLTARNSTVTSYTIKNRAADNDSILKQYRNAKTVKFSNTTPTTYASSIIIDDQYSGGVKAYQVNNADGSYGVVIAADKQIYAGPTSLASMFKNFKKLVSVDFGNLNTTKATSMIGMFSGCEALPSVTINFDTTKVTDYRWMFDAGCVALTSVEFGSNATMAANAQLSYMFQDCIALSKLVVRNTAHWADTTGDSTGMFLNCTKIPGFSSNVTNNSLCYAGVKNGVTGYFYSV